jgi:hypothetical protein
MTFNGSNGPKGWDRKSISLDSGRRGRHLSFASQQGPEFRHVWQCRGAALVQLLARSGWSSFVLGNAGIPDVYNLRYAPRRNGPLSTTNL